MCMYACMRTCVCVCVCLSVCVCACVCTYVDTRISICTVCAFVYVYNDLFVHYVYLDFTTKVTA